MRWPWLSRRDVDAERASLLERAVRAELERDAVRAEAEAARTPADRLLSETLRRRFVVTLHDGATFDGLLVDVDDKVLVLFDARALGVKEHPVPVDGALYLERDRVAYMQAPRGLPSAS